MTRNPQSTTHSEKRPVPSNKSRVRDSDHRFTRQVTEITRTTTQNPHTYTHPPTTTLPPSAASTRFSLTDRLGSPIHQSARTRTHAHTHTRTHAHTHTRTHAHTRARSPFYKFEVEHDTGQDDLDEEKHGNVDPRPEQNADGEPECRPVSSSAGKIRACNPRKRKKNGKKSKRESRVRSQSPPSPPVINDKKETLTKTLHATSNK
jgi:hypothetical protein